MFRLNDSQMRTLAKKLSSGIKISGIQGPPGTGKSRVASILAVAKALEGNRILCLAYQNKSIDQLSSYILFNLHKISSILGISVRKLFCRVGWMPRIKKEIIPYYSSYHGARDKMIVATTAYSSRHLPNRTPTLDEFARQGFDTLLVEESGQIPAHQAWISLENIDEDFDSVIAIGDDKQIFPQSPDFRKEPSILYNLRRLTPNEIDMLEITYRLPEPGLTMTSDLFYEGKLTAPLDVMNRRIQLKEHLESSSYSEALDPENTVFYLSVKNDEEEWKGNSWFNIAQARGALKVTSEFIDRGCPPGRISLISPYAAQRQYLQKKLRDYDLPVNCTTVHGMLGLENDLVIFVVTRSNRDHDIGFLRSQPEILNVATTRHRCKLIIVGDHRDTFSDGSNYSRKMFEFMDTRGLVGEVNPSLSFV